MNTGSAAERRPRARALIAESIRAALARPVSLALTAVVVAAACAVILATAGRTAATEAQVLASIDSVGTRLITVTDTDGSADIHPASVEAISELDGVAWALGLGPATEAINPTLGATTGPAIPARPIVGEIPADVGTLTGREAKPGEAIAGSAAADALGLIDSAGGIDTRQGRLAVVGQMQTTGAISGLESTVLYRVQSEDFPLRIIYVLADPGIDIASLAAAVDASLLTPVPAAAQTTTSEAALALREVVSGVLGGASRQLMGIVLTAGLFLISVTAYGAVASRRTDFGRQRALGATRLDIAVAVLSHTAFGAIIGTVIGGTLGLIVTYVLTGSTPTPRFTTGLLIMVIYMALLGSLPPAIAAARRDPVRILRVP
jgi:putative ABC transport system permease protein